VQIDINAPERPQTDLLTEFEAACAFPLDPFQVDAIQHLIAGRSVLVAAPTSSGKTIVAEFGIYRGMQMGQRVIYTSPLKALSNQKFGDFCRVWGNDVVGLLTGDISVHPDASVRVMTTEVLRNMLLQSPEGMNGVQTVVLDEFHYLGDAERGRVWEEIVILLPRNVQIIALSATMSNAEQMRLWMERVHGATALVLSERRPVPLEIHYFLDGKLYRAIDANGRVVARIKAGGEAHKLRRRFAPPGTRSAPRPTPQYQPVTSADVVASLATRNLLPAIYFVFSRAKTEREASRCAASTLDLVSSDSQRERIERAIAETMAFMSEEHRGLPQVTAMMLLLRRGFAFHHAGLLPGLKVLVETLFADGVLGVVFATETLSLGINMPARSVVIPQLTKYDGTSNRPLSAREFHQLIGRAGRRGMDVAGNAILVHDEWMSYDEAIGIAKRPLEPVMSSFQLGYNSLINLLRTYNDREVLVWLMHQSLLAHQMVGRRDVLLAERATLEAQANGKGPGCLIGGPDTLHDFNRLTARLEAAQVRHDELEDELRHSRKRRSSAHMPDDDVRRQIRQAEGGELLYITSFGWSALVQQPDGPLVVPLDGLTEGARRRRLSLSYDQIEAIRMKPRLDLDRLPHMGTRGTDALPRAERTELRRQLDALEPRGSTESSLSPAEQARHARIHQLEQKLAELKTEIGELGVTVREHRCATCPVLGEHRKLIRWSSTSHRLIENLDLEIAQLAAAEERDLRDVVSDMMTLLEKFGFLVGGACAPKADMLARIVDPNTLIISELVISDIMDGIPTEEVAEVLSWFAESDADGLFQNLKGSLKDLWFHVRLLSEAIMDEENRVNLYHSRGPSPAHPGLVRAWCRGMAFPQLMVEFEMAEGDGIRYLKKSGDLLRQVRRALEETGLKPELRLTIAAAEQAVRRDIVVSQELLELSEVIDVAAEELPPEIRDELADVTHDTGDIHPPVAQHHQADLHLLAPMDVIAQSRSGV